MTSAGVVFLVLCAGSQSTASTLDAPAVTRTSARTLPHLKRTEHLASLQRKGPVRDKELVSDKDAVAAVPAGWKAPSIYWAILSNWLYFLSLGFNAINVAYLVRSIVNADGSTQASPAAIALSGNVETVDKMLTFLGVGFLSALSDVRGRKPLMVWSALGFGLTNLIQATTHNSIGLLYLADFVDGCSSCMTPICQAYVVDCSPAEKRAQNLGIFQGLSIGCAFILAFPIGGILGAKYGPR
eukprot:5393542-Prymnesium_polylepis.1